MWKTSLAFGLLALGATTLASRAADMPLFPQPTYADQEPAPQFEWGTGWYLRGDLSASYDDEIAYSTAFTGALQMRPYVPPTGNLFATKQDWGYAAGAGAGYKFGQYFRADITGDYLSTQRLNNNSFGAIGKATVRRWDGLVNGYFDLGNWGGIQPYIGAGVGFAAIKTKGTLFDGTTALDGITATLQTEPGKDRYNLAWAAMAGFGYQIAPHMLLDVGYRYLDMGKYTVPFTNEKKTVVDQQARVGIRYVID